MRAPIEETIPRLPSSCPCAVVCTHARRHAFRVVCGRSSPADHRLAKLKPAACARLASGGSRLLGSCRHLQGLVPPSLPLSF